MISELLDAASLKAMGGKLAIDKQDAKAVLRSIARNSTSTNQGYIRRARRLLELSLEKTTP